MTVLRLCGLCNSSANLAALKLIYIDIDIMRYTNSYYITLRVGRVGEDVTRMRHEETAVVECRLGRWQTVGSWSSCDACSRKFYEL